MSNIELRFKEQGSKVILKYFLHTNITNNTQKLLFHHSTNKNLRFIMRLVPPSSAAKVMTETE